MKRLLIVYILLIILITITSATIIIDKNKEISKLKEINLNLKYENKEYKWQLEQVPLVVESNLDNLCKENYEKNKR